MRRRVRLTLILDPGLGLVVWVHYAPPLSDSFRKTYRQLLRWNDELPFARFAISEDDRPVLIAEVPFDRLDRDSLGTVLARLLATCDLLHNESMTLMSELRRKSAQLAALPADPAGAALLERYSAALGELGSG